jgi:rSAM/selenodomain-associated transferase 1
VDVVQLFLKAPRPGTVKTRLAASVGEAEAVRIYRGLAERQLNALERKPDRRIEIHYAPEGAESEMRAWLGEDLDCLPQCEGDLGDRLAYAVERAFQSGAKHVFCLGADCPALEESHIQQAGKALRDVDVVFGPATDGGYYLLALKACHPCLFRDIPWSTSNTLEVSRLRASAAGLSVALLKQESDVDTLEDWQRFSNRDIR